MERKDTFLWYFLLSIIGLFTAEVCSWSSPFVIIDPFTFIFVWPVYAAHYFVFVPILLEKKWYKDWRIVYAFGVLLGLYEFVITKVFWTPTWDYLFKFMGVAIIEFIWVGLIWHPFFSFMIPFYIMIFLFFPVEEELAKKWLKRIFYAIVLTFSIFGVISPTMSVLASQNLHYFGIVIMALLVFLIQLYFRVLAFRFRKIDYKLADFIPSQRTRMLSIIFLLAVYAIYGASLRTEYIPTDATAYIIPILSYALTILFILKSEKRIYLKIVKSPPLIKRIDPHILSVYMFRFLIVVFVVWLISLVENFIMFLVLFVSELSSPILFLYIVYKIIRKQKPKRESSK